MSDVVDFRNLCRELTRYYKDFDEHFQTTIFRDGGRVSRDASCLVTFGISGAGKSTFVGRLLSGMPASDFYNLIMDREGENKETCTTEEGITIGHTHNSTTVVPKLYSISGLHVCDMPGFAENNPQKKIAIQVLQKCFLTRISRTAKSTFLVVVDIKAIEDTKCETILEHYHKPLKALLGDEQYKTVTEHLYFALTKNDEHNFDSEYVQNRLANVALDMISEVPDAAAFLNRMRKRHVIVDLKSENNFELLEKIDQMIRHDQAQKSRLQQLAMGPIEKLLAGDNTLHKLCIQHVAALAKRRDELKENCAWLSEQWTTQREGLEQHTKEVIAAQRSEENGYAEAKGELEKVVKELEDHEPATKMVEDKQRKTAEILTVRQRQSKLFDEHFTVGDFISFQRFASKEELPAKAPRGKKQPPPPKHTMNISVDVTSDGSHDRLILVMENEGNDDTLKQQIGRGKSLIPHSLKQIRSINAPGVLYNSHLMINTIDAQVKGGDYLNGVIDLVMTHDKPFKAYIYSASPFKQLQYFADFRGIFNADMEKDKKTLAILKKKLEELNKKKEKNMEEARGLKTKLDNAKKRVEGCVVVAKAEHKRHADKCYATTAKFHQLVDQINGLKAEPEIQHIQEIEHIFRKNSIVADLTSELAELLAGFAPLTESVKKAVSAVDQFHVLDSKDLAGLFEVEY